MFNEVIDLYAYFGAERNGVNGGYLTVYARTESREISKIKRPAMLVIPGGGYWMLSDREAEPVALKFVEKGFSAFVLAYSVQTKYPAPLNEAQMAVAYIRRNADKYNIDGEKLCAVGFSAGGHLTGMLATVKREEVIAGESLESVKPNAVVLSYPVVTMGELTHQGTRDVITGGEEALREKLSIEKRADENSVPAFIWHTMEDDCVPVENSMTLAGAYRKNGVPFALTVFEKGHHGLALADDETCRFSDGQKNLYCVGKWVELAYDWLASRGFGSNRN